MRYARVTQPHSPWVAPRPLKKRETRARQIKALGAGLEDFLDWTGVANIEPFEEDEMFSL